MADNQANRPHRPAKKKKKQRAPGEKNPKAFAFNAPGKLQRSAARSQDVREKRLHVPLVDRLPEEAPPIVVGVVGPPGVRTHAHPSHLKVLVLRGEDEN